MKHKEPLRKVLVARSLVKTDDEAQRYILAGQVRVDGVPVHQVGTLVSSSAEVRIDAGSKYVSRGGLKLEGALADFSFNPQGLNCIDAGASSGGFTDCLLQHGAKSVVSVDVGYGQFDWKLRQDERVTLFERTNIAKVDPAKLGAPFDVLVADLSFTSLARLAPQLCALLTEGSDALTLVKPQFELPKDSVKNGVVRSFDLHVQALARVQDAYAQVGLFTQNMTFSHLLGPKGNIEFWIWASKQDATATIDAEHVVRRAHQELGVEGIPHAQDTNQ